MSYQEVLNHHRIAISASDSPDMPVLGLSEAHLRDAMTEIARHILALGAKLYYGGDLRAGGFSELLFELVERHRRDSQDDEMGTDIFNFLAWPVHLRMEFRDIERAIADLAGIAELICLDEAGTRLALDDRQQVQSREPCADEWAIGLTAMRRLKRSETTACIVLGGQVENFKGIMPGIAEEALISINAGQPLYVVGGFGGCARDIAETLNIVKPWRAATRSWFGRVAFEPLGIECLRNGLTTEENETLARTPHVDQAIILILKGLLRI